MKKKFLDLLSHSFAFMMLGFILGLFTPVVPKLFIPEITGILMESIAPKSIMLLLITDALFTVVLLKLCGTFDPQKKVAACFYKIFSFTLNKLGKSITAATFGALFGLTLATLFYGEFCLAGVGVKFSLMLIVIWGTFDFLSHMGKNAVDKIERRMFYFVVIGITAYYIYIIATQTQVSPPCV